MVRLTWITITVVGLAILADTASAQSHDGGNPRCAPSHTNGDGFCGNAYGVPLQPIYTPIDDGRSACLYSNRCYSLPILFPRVRRLLRPILPPYHPHY